MEKYLLRDSSLRHGGRESPPREAVKKLFQYADLRMKVIIGIFFSGCRLGAIEWFNVSDTLRDIRQANKNWKAGFTGESLNNTSLS